MQHYSFVVQDGSGRTMQLDQIEAHTFRHALIKLSTIVTNDAASVTVVASMNGKEPGYGAQIR